MTLSIKTHTNCDGARKHTFGEHSSDHTPQITRDDNKTRTSTYFQPRTTDMLRTDSPPATLTATLSTIATTATMPSTRHRQQQERLPQPRGKRNCTHKRARRTSLTSFLQKEKQGSTAVTNEWTWLLLAKHVGICFCRFLGHAGGLEKESFLFTSPGKE